MAQRYVGVGRIALLGNNGETIEIQMCNGCGSLVLNEAKHNAFHVRMGDDPSRRMVTRDEAGRAGIQVGDGNVQTNTWGPRP